jgi:uncharacterized RDD family membrane protein YckC
VGHAVAGWGIEAPACGARRTACLIKSTWNTAGAGGGSPSNVDTFEPPAAGPPRSGSLWRRGLAFLVFDQLQMTLTALVLALLFSRTRAVLDPRLAIVLASSLRGALEPVQLAAAWLYWTSRESSEARATHGKRFAGLVVTDLRGGRLSFRQPLGRNFVKQGIGLVLVLGLPALGLDRETALLAAGAFVWAECLLAVCTPQRRALHDLVAGSIVVRREAAPGELPLPRQQP